MSCKILIVAAALCLAAGAAQAQTKPSITVKASDLDLSTPKGAQQLYDRVYEAASVVCGGGALVTFVPFPDSGFETCRKATIDAVLSKFHSPAVAALREAVQPAGRPAPR